MFVNFAYQRESNIKNYLQTHTKTTMTVEETIELLNKAGYKAAALLK